MARLPNQLVMEPRGSGLSTCAMFTSVSVRGRLLASLCALTVAAFAVAAFQYMTTSRLLANLEIEQARTTAAAQAYSGLAEGYRDQETGVRGFLLTRDEVFLQPYLAGRSSEPVLLAGLLQTSGNTPGVETALAGTRAAAVEWQERYAIPAVLGATDDPAPASLASMREGKALFDISFASGWLTSKSQSVRPTAASSARSPRSSGSGWHCPC